MASKARVSVVIPTFNHARFLRLAVDSALRQSLDGVEIIVVDDGSTDETETLMAAYAERIIYVKQANRGLAAARNAGLRRSRGEFVKFLDADDELYPDTLASEWGVARTFPERDVFTSSWDEIDADGVVTARVVAPDLPEDASHRLFDPMVIGPPCRYLVRRAAFAAAGDFDTRLRSCEDWNLWLRMAATGRRFGVIATARVRYRNTAGSMSKNYRVMWQSGLAVLAAAGSMHPHCHACRVARQRGIAIWRDWCYVSMLGPQLREMCGQKQYLAAAREAILASARDPLVISRLARSAVTGTRGARRLTFLGRDA